jgi:hypothetical protein
LMERPTSFRPPLLLPYGVIGGPTTGVAFSTT